MVHTVHLQNARLGRGRVAGIGALCPQFALQRRDVDGPDPDTGVQRHRRRDAGRLTHRHAGRDLARYLLRRRGRRVMPPGDQQPVDAPRQHRAIGRVVVTAARDAVGEVHAAGDVVLGDDILAVQEPGLAHPGLRRDVDHVAAREARQVGARIVDQSMDPAAAFELGVGQIFDLQPVEAGHVRAVAPDDARQRGLQPPVVPASADDAFGLAVDGAEAARLVELEAFGFVGIDAAQAEHRRDHVAAVDERGTGAGRHIQIAGRIDHRRPMIAWRPALVSSRRPRCRRRGPARAENQLCSRSSTPASRTMSSETRFQPSGSNATA